MNAIGRIWKGGAIAVLLVPHIVFAQTSIPLLDSLIPPETVRTFESLNQGVNTLFDLRDRTRDALGTPYLQETRRTAEEYGRRGVSVVQDWDRTARAEPGRIESQAWNAFVARLGELRGSIFSLPGEVWRDALGLWARFEEACKGKHILCVL